MDKKDFFSRLFNRKIHVDNPDFWIILYAVVQLRLKQIEDLNFLCHFCKDEQFQLLVIKKSNKKLSETIEWENARLICIAGDYTKYDSYAVQQINRNIELIRYKKFDDLLLFELVNVVSGELPSQTKTKNKIKYSTVDELLNKSSAEVKDLFESLKAFIISLGDDIQLKELKFYFAFKKIKNFASVEIHPQNNTIVLFLSLKPKPTLLIDGFSRDVSKIGHLGTGNLELTIKSIEDFENSKPYIIKSYELN